MTLDRAFVSQRKSQSKLSSKPNQGKIFGSVDSSKEIYRSTEESTTTLSQSCENAFGRKCSSKDNMYDVDLKSEDRDDKCPFIFVIGSNSNESWAQARNIHQNNGFDQDSDELFKSRTENRIDRASKSMVNPNLTRKDGSRDLDQVNGS